MFTHLSDGSAIDVVGKLVQPHQRVRWKPGFFFRANDAYERVTQYRGN